MNDKYPAIGLFALSLFLVVFGYFISHPEIVGWCEGDTFGCINQDILFGIGHPLMLSLYLVPPFFFALIFIRKEVFWAWAKFISVFAVIGLIIIARTSPMQVSILSLDRTVVTDLVVKGLVALSIIFIVWKYWTLSKKKK